MPTTSIFTERDNRTIGYGTAITELYQELYAEGVPAMLRLMAARAVTPTQALAFRLSAQTIERTLEDAFGGSVEVEPEGEDLGVGGGLAPESATDVPESDEVLIIDFSTEYDWERDNALNARDAVHADNFDVERFGNE